MTPGRPRRGTELPAAVVAEAYRDLSTPLRVSAARLGVHFATLARRAQRMGIRPRAWLQAEQQRPCTGCGEFRPLVRHLRCADCRRAYDRAWRAAQRIADRAGRAPAQEE